MAADRTHYEGCWRAHHECAVAMVELLRDEDAASAAIIDEIATDLAAAGYRHDQGHGPSYPPEPGDVPGIVRDVLARLARAEARAERLEAIVQGFTEEDDVEIHPVTGRARCCRCRRWEVGGYIDHRPDCLWLRAR